MMNVLLLNVLMVNLTVMVMAQNVFMDHGHVTVMVTAPMAQMKLIVVAADVPMVNLHVLMDLVFMTLGHATAMVTALMAVMKLTVLLHHVKIKA